MFQQIAFFYRDCKRRVGKRWFLWPFILFSPAIVGTFWYRFERGMFLTLGKVYKVVRLLFTPLEYIFQSYSNIDIHYEADIAGGLAVLHPSIGVVVSGKVIAGRNLTLTGGNTIGISKKTNWGDFVIGNDCVMGANATIMGGLKLGDGITIGANACVTKSFLENGIKLAGVPAKKL